MTDPVPSFEHSTKRILVVDDDRSVRDMLVRVLVEDGYKATSAADGNEAVEMAAEEPFDLALLDVGLPGKNGWETFINLTRETPSLAVIIITARSNQQSIATHLAADALFEKPLDFPLLLRTVRELLDKTAPKLS